MRSFSSRGLCAAGSKDAPHGLARSVKRKTPNFGGGVTFRNTALRRPETFNQQAQMAQSPLRTLWTCPSSSSWGALMPPELALYPRHLSEDVVRAQSREPPPKLSQRWAAPAWQNWMAGHLSAPSYQNCPPGVRCRRHRTSAAIVQVVHRQQLEASPPAQASAM